MSTNHQSIQKRRAETYANSMVAEHQEKVRASQELVTLLVSSLGDDLGKAIALMEKAGTDASLTKALKEARKQARPARRRRRVAEPAYDDAETAFLTAHAASFTASSHLNGKAPISGLSDEEARRRLEEARAMMERLSASSDA